MKERELISWKLSHRNTALPVSGIRKPDDGEEEEEEEEKEEKERDRDRERERDNVWILKTMMMSPTSPKDWGLDQVKCKPLSVGLGNSPMRVAIFHYFN